MTCLLNQVGHFSYCVSAEKIGLLGRKENDNYILKMFYMEISLLSYAIFHAAW